MIQLLQSLDMHTHRFKGITSTERLHYHNFHDVTYLAPNVRQHHHAYYTYTTQDFNHKHLMLGITGPALYRQDGSHTHRLQSLTSINGGKSHYHEFRVITSRHYVPHITPPPIGPPSKPPKPTQPIAPPSKPSKPPKPTQPIAPPPKPVKPPKPTQPIAPPPKPVKPPKPTQPIAPPSKPAEPPKPTQPIAPPSKPTEPPKPTQPIAPPSKPTEPPKPTQPIEPAEPIQLIE
ncbi:YmaF family protein [Mycoplasmatota bacterium zrk1]